MKCANKLPLLQQKHATTSQLIYQGTIVELAEAISILPAGGQILLTNQTLQLASHQTNKAQKAVKQLSCQVSNLLLYLHVVACTQWF